MSFCPSKDIHSVYLDGELPENYKAEYELHIANCEKCRKELEQLKAVSNLFKADSSALNLDEKFMDESFQRLQIKMAYNRNVLKAPRKSSFRVITYVASGIAAAAVLALVLPLGLKSKQASTEVSAVEKTRLFQSVSSGSTVPITAVSTGARTSDNNVPFDSGRSVVVSGNIQDVVLSSKNKNNPVFTRNVNDVDVLRPDFQDEAISIKITVPGMGDFPVTTEINVPMDLVSGRH
ncbi:Putative zinc-finger [Treponema bryantii]|uniref:Putative zinc-finger n=1 Tax=Treponema bryantii TaxID=163 RepID=A0A1H9CGE6_9SPIR|nr:zf-HC2 domain-containing protein [Treponema bryantii]BDC92437.1 hypothetical protein TRBR_05340 [Treponema bryantii]SEQ00121.1 Putative zinc-finger [Treponema bryantii]